MLRLGIMTAAILSVGAAFAQMAPTTPPLFGVNPQLVQQNSLDVSTTGVVGDGQKGFYYAAWAKNANTLAVATLTATVTATGTAVSWSGTFSGPAFQPDDVGKSICIDGAGAAGGVYRGTIVTYTSSEAVVVSPSVQTNLSSASGTRLGWPCFQPTDVGKSIWVDRANQYLTTNAVNLQQNPAMGPFLTTIASVVDGLDITTAVNFPFNTNNFIGALPGPVKIVWGTDNSATLSNGTVPLFQAGLNAVAQGMTRLYFPKGLYVAFNIGPPYPTLYTAPLGMYEFMSQVLWLGNNSESFFTDSGGTEISKKIVPAIAPSVPPAPKGVYGSSHLQRTAAAAANNGVINVVGWGDSQCVPPPQYPNPSSFGEVPAILAQLQRVYNVPINFVNRSMGGAAFTWLDSVATPGVFPDWYTNHSASWESYVSTIPIGQGASVVQTTPDLVLLCNNGGNDSSNLFANAFYSLVNKIKAWTPDAAGRTPDIITLTTLTPSVVRKVQNNTFGSDYQEAQQAYEYTATFIRSASRKLGIGFLDHYAQGGVVHLGWDPTRLNWRTYPNMLNQTTTPTAPYVMPFWTRNFAAQYLITAADGPTAWPAGQTISIQVGNRPDNVVIVGTDASGYLTVQQNLWGNCSTATASIASGMGALTVSGSTSSSNTVAATIKDLILGSNVTFSPGLSGVVAGSFLYLPTFGYSALDGGAWRTFINDKPQLASGFTTDGPPDGGVSATTQTITYNGVPFIPSDATAQIDITIAGAGAAGGLYTGKVTGYTNIGSVTVTPPASTTLSAVANTTICIGRISVPLFSSQVQAGMDGGANPILGIAIDDTQLVVEYQRASDTKPLQIYRGPMEKFGGQFNPVVKSSVGTFTLNGQNIWIDEPKFSLPQLTDIEMWGTGDSIFAYKYGGSNAHPTAYASQRVDVPLAEAQEWGGVGNSADVTNGVHSTTPLAFSGGEPSSKTSSINLNNAVSGTCLSATRCFVNQFAILDTATNSSANAFYHNWWNSEFAGGAAGAGKIANQMDALISHTFTGTQPSFSTLRLSMNMQSNMGGGVGSEKGAGFVLNPQCIVGTGSVNIAGCVIMENDYSVATGINYLDSAFILNSISASHRTKGTRNNYSFSTQLGVAPGGSTPGLDVLVQDGGFNGYPSLDPNGAIFQCYPHGNTGNCGTINMGMDFSKYSTVTTALLLGPGSNGRIDGDFNITAASLAGGGSPPTASGSCPINTQVGGNTVGKFTMNGACAAGTVILTFAKTATNGWACDTTDQTTAADNLNQTASSATTATFTGTTANNDVISFKCMAF